MRSNSWVEADTLDDLVGLEAAGLRVGVELVEIGHPQGQIRVGEELDGLRLRGAEHELGDPRRSVGVRAAALGGVGALGKQSREAFRSSTGLSVIRGRTHYNATGMKIVVQRMPLAQELRREDDAGVPALGAQALGVADGDGGLDDDPRAGVHRPHRVDRRLHGRGVEEIPVGVVVRGGGDDRELRPRVRLGGVGRGPQVQRPLPPPRLGQEPLDLRVPDGRLEAVDHVHLRGDDVQGADLVVLREQDGDGQADVACACDCDLHVISSL